MPSYTKKYLYIYVVQALSMLLGMLSLFLIVPYISTEKEIYGVYAICSSLTIFYSYADIGFLGASIKFASEAYIQNKHHQELKILGFSGFVFGLLLIVVSIAMLGIACKPEMLIQGIMGEEKNIASQLLTILACSSPIFCFQRICQIIYSIRLCDYYYQFYQIIGNIIKIISVFWFFGGGNYDIVGFYLNYQLISAVVVIVAFGVARVKFKYNICELLSYFKFDKYIFNKLKSLAFASLFGTVCWILYYEIDNLVISYTLGAQAVAVYAVAFSVLTIFRNIYGSLYSPYPARFNYYTGLKDYLGLNSFVKTIMEFFMPICLIPIIIMMILAMPFIMSWAGEGYEESAQILIYLLCGNFLAFFSYPSGHFIISLQKNKYLYYINGIIVVVFWLGVILTYKEMGVKSFAVMKALGMLLSSIYCIIIVFRIVDEPIFKFFQKLIIRYGFPIVCCALISLLIKPYMMYQKGSIELLINMVFIIMVGLSSYISVLFFSPLHREKIRQIVNMIKK